MRVQSKRCNRKRGDAVFIGTLFNQCFMRRSLRGHAEINVLIYKKSTEDVQRNIFDLNGSLYRKTVLLHRRRNVTICVPIHIKKAAFDSREKGMPELFRMVEIYFTQYS